MRKKQDKSNGYSKNIILMLDAFLVIGLFSHAVILCMINKYLDPKVVSEGYVIVKQRIFWRIVATKICEGCIAIYIFGRIWIIYKAIKHKLQFCLKKLISFFFYQIGIMLICVVPFGIIDRSCFYDYIFPLYAIVFSEAVLLVVSIFSICSKK